MRDHDAHNGRYILNAAGEPEPCEDLLTWGRWMETADRHVALTRFGEIRVSTVFLGLDHRFGDGPPVLFESMVFGGPLDQEMERYSTRAEADAGHTALCQAVVAALETTNPIPDLFPADSEGDQKH